MPDQTPHVPPNLIEAGRRASLLMALNFHVSPHTEHRKPVNQAPRLECCGKSGQQLSLCSKTTRDQYLD